MKQKLSTIVAMLAMVWFITGCTKFLEVEPKSSVSDEKLYSDEVGYKQALTGIYVSLASQQLYGANMTMGAVSAMGQDYNLPAGHVFAPTGNFVYTKNSYMADIWNKGYFTIASINSLLSNIDKNKSVFSGDHYNLTKGEALALRAYLHFDLLRLFGPRFETGKLDIAIPYRMNFTTKVEPAQSVEMVCKNALRDLDEAIELLKDDPIRQAEMTRRYYMNYYAALATKARILQYMGDPMDKTVAAQVLKDQVFSFVKPAAISTTDIRIKDRLFSDELIMALRVIDIEKWVKIGPLLYGPYFYESRLTNGRLTRPLANFRTLFESPVKPNNAPADDYRFRYLIEMDGATYFPSKYWQTWSNVSGTATRLDLTVPLFRMSELYYIMAEGAATIDEALGYLNTVRRNRGITNDLTTEKIVNKELLRQEITKEYQKEFYAEGQTFYYFKRIGAITMPPFRISPAILPENYKVDIPAGELDFNPTY